MLKEKVKKKKSKNPETMISLGAVSVHVAPLLILLFYYFGGRAKATSPKSSFIMKFTYDSILF